MTPVDLVIIGASWGGLRAVSTILRGLAADFASPVVVVQHRAEDADDRLAGLLDRAGPLEVREADDKQPLRAGSVHLAPPGYHVLVERGHLALSTEERVRYSRPSIDVAFETAALAFGAGLVGVVLTGANEDGSVGLRTVRRCGGTAVVQDPATAEQPVMPAAAVAQAEPQFVVALEEIAPLLTRLTSSPAVSP